MHPGSVDRVELAASISTARKGRHHACPRQVSFDMSSHQLAAIAVEISSFGRLRQRESDFIDQMTATVIGGADGDSLATKGVCKERIIQVISVTTQVELSRRMHRFKLNLGDTRPPRNKPAGCLP